MNRPAPRTLAVVRKTTLTPNMLRITLGGDGMASFPPDQASAYVKLMFPHPGDERPITRTYTVRAQRDHEIDIDFVIHADGGPAVDWAIDAQSGDSIMVGGPGPKKMLDPEADWFLIVGDMTALPAIGVNIESLPAHARGHAVIEVVGEADIQALVAPKGLSVHWVINPHPGHDSNTLFNAVKTLDWPAGRPSVWAACEFSGMRKLRGYFRNERGLDKTCLYISSYWKLGSSEERHKIVKREDRQTVNS